MDKLEGLLASQQLASESLGPVFLNFLLCLIFSTLVSWFYKKNAMSLGGKTHVGSILPLIGMTVFLVITVVKGSLALSLGLVGALSIVRFRTPIKEPEELGYLFFVIAIGLGFGASLEIITSILTLAILGYLLIAGRSKHLSQQFGEYTLVVSICTAQFSEACKIIERNTDASKITRVEHDGFRSTVYYNVASTSGINSQGIIGQLVDLDKAARLDLVEAGVNW